MFNCEQDSFWFIVYKLLFYNKNMPDKNIYRATYKIIYRAIYKIIWLPPTVKKLYNFTLYAKDVLNMNENYLGACVHCVNNCK